MLKKPNLTAEEKTRLKNEILSALSGDKKILTSSDFSTAASSKTPVPPAPVKAPASVAVAKMPVVSTAPVIKPTIKVEKKAIIKADKKNIKKQPTKELAPFVLVPEAKLRLKSDHKEKHRIKQGLSMLRFIIFLLIIIAVLLTVDMFLLAGK